MRWKTRCLQRNCPQDKRARARTGGTDPSTRAMGLVARDAVIKGSPPADPAGAGVGAGGGGGATLRIPRRLFARESTVHGVQMQRIPRPHTAGPSTKVTFISKTICDAAFDG